MYCNSIELIGNIIIYRQKHSRGNLVTARHRAPDTIRAVRHFGLWARGRNRANNRATASGITK